MKIKKLKLLNINSLKGNFEIDFQEFLDDISLFAITGPTGAGKSTILDVITCALYGRTPRLTNANELMSRNCGECFCEVEFEVKNKTYRSSWSQKRARKKPDGKFQTAKMEIVDLSSNKILESKLREVPKVIEQLTGLDFDRFIQSMMLAQGSFDAFLKAKENERSSLLEKITGTYIYKQISQNVYEIYSNKKKEIENDELLLGNIELLDKDILEEKTKELEKIKQNKKSLDKKETELKKISIWLDTLQKLQRDNIKYTNDFEQISKEKDSNKQEFIKLELANKALRMEPINQEKNQLFTTISNDKQRLVSLKEEKETLTKDIITKTKEMESAKETLEKEKVSYKQNIEKIKKLRVLQTQYENKNSLIIQKDQKISNYLQGLSKMLDVDYQILLGDETKLQNYYKSFLDSLNSSKEHLDKLLNEYQILDEKTKDINTKENSIRERLKRLDKLLESLEDHQKLHLQITEEKNNIKQFQTKIEFQNKLNSEKIELIKQIEKTLDILKEARQKDLLIKNYEQDRLKLQEGQECFLCGSKVHPYIEHSIHIDIDKSTQKIKEQENNLSKQNKELTQIQISLARLASQLESSTLNLEKLQVSITQIEEFFKANNFKIKQDSKANLQEQSEQNEKILKEYINLREKKESLQKQKETFQLKLNQQEQKNQQIESNIKTIKELKGEKKSLEDQLKELKLKSISILDIKDIDQFEKTIQENLENVSKQYNNLQTQLSNLQTNDRSILKQIGQLEQKQIEDNQTLQILNGKFNQALEEYGFSSREEFEKANLPKEQFESLSIFCKNIQDRYTQIQTLKIDTAKKLKEHKEKEKELNLENRKLEDINKQLQELQIKMDELQKSIGSIEKELEINALNMKKSEDKIKELEKKKEDSKVWVKLNDMIGSSQGDKFAKFAQGITLDQLIYLANKHLQILSPRYELQRATDSSKILDIEIIDGFQGDAIRGVNTLSGGESFIVSLSLALGLSSLASQKISIDSLFLDEGFGTLDSNSLELALNALNQLQSSGKMIGIISHVEALKERIPLQIKVEPKGDGTSEVVYE